MGEGFGAGACSMWVRLLDFVASLPPTCTCKEDQVSGVCMASYCMTKVRV